MKRFSVFLVCAFAFSVFIPANVDWPLCLPALPWWSCKNCVLIKMQCQGDPCLGNCRYTYEQALEHCSNIGACP